jgi:hypothetical protein
MISFGAVAKPETDATPHRKTEVGRKLPEPKPEINWESISNEQLKNMKSGRGGGKDLSGVSSDWLCHCARFHKVGVSITGIAYGAWGIQGVFYASVALAIITVVVFGSLVTSKKSTAVLNLEPLESVSTIS